MTAHKKHRVRTLWFVGGLHAFTHVYQVALLPLYFLIREDLKLESIEQATLLVTAMMLSYFIPSYGMGMLADRLSRKKLLAFGLLLNGLAFAALAFVHSYLAALGCMIMAGLGGSFFHPSANPLIARLFPAETGKALGLIGIGASVGFFLGPLYAGWRAAISGWRMPVFELGIAGVIFALLFWYFAEEEAPAQKVMTSSGTRTRSEPLFETPALWMFFFISAFAFSLRDFTGSSMGSLGSLFLQEARGFDIQKTGFTIGFIFIASAISNPLFGSLSDRARMRWISLVLSIASVLVVVFPHVHGNWTPVILAWYGFFFMASYPMVEAALMQSVHDSVRGRVFGLFITIGGIVGNLAHWLAGEWVKKLGTKAHIPEGYFMAYGLLALLLLGSLIGLPCLHALRKKEAEHFPELAVDPV
jgi:FSR family fosmidomycin resistance protein-like MFS transporter